MLTNLNWLTEGKPWPPVSENKRIKYYKDNERLFLTEHDQVWKDRFENLANKYKKKNKKIDTIINYHQLISKKTADFVCGEAPSIEAGDNTDKLMELLNEQDFFSKLYEEVIDISRYGNGLMKFVGKDITVAIPQHWIPIVDPTNLKKIQQDVIGYLTDTDSDGKPTGLYVEIHAPGRLEIRRHKYDAATGTIGSQIENPRVEENGIEISAVQKLTNLTHSGSVFGLDDYNIVNSIIAKIMWRMHCGNTVLDKHSEPSMTGPESALEYDEKLRTWFVPLGNYFKRTSKDEPPFGYVTWDGNLDSNFKELELLLDQLYILTEMGQAFADAGGDANDSSGTALKLRMVSPRIKAQRLVNLNNAKVKRIIHTLAKLNGIDIDYNSLTITWADGLPQDEVEQTERLSTATGNKPIMSQYSALRKQGMTDKQAKEELARIQDEDAAAAPVVNVPRSVDEPIEGDAE